MRFKYILFFILFISILLQADSEKNISKTLSNVTGINVKKNNSKKEFGLAKKLFNSKQYKKAYLMLKKLFLKDLSNPNINFYLGRSAYKLKKYEEAVAAYERIVIVNPKAYRVKLEMARCYQRLGLTKDAKKIFIDVRSKVPASVQKNIDIYLAAIEAKRKKHSLKGAVILGVNYDNNIYSVTVDNALSDKISNYTLKNKASNGLAHQEVVAANYAYAKSETIKYKADFVFFNKSIFKYHDMDLSLVQVTPAVLVRYNNGLSIGYAVFANKVWLSSKPLMQDWGIYPKIQYAYSKTLKLNGAFKYQSQENSANNANRDNHTYSLEIGAQKTLSKTSTFGVKTKFDLVREKMSGELGDLNEVAYNLYELTLNLNYKFRPKIVLTPKLKIYQKNYIDKSIAPLSGQKLYKRSDEEYQIWLSGTYIYSPKMLFTFEYVHSVHDSNYADNRFKKDTFSANVIMPF